MAIYFFLKIANLRLLKIDIRRPNCGQFGVCMNLESKDKS